MVSLGVILRFGILKRVSLGGVKNLEGGKTPPQKFGILSSYNYALVKKL